MTLISHREHQLLGSKNEEINSLLEEIKAFLEEITVPEDCKIDVFKDAVGCCGYFPLGIAVEIEGPSKRTIEDLDLRICSKIIEIFEREGIDYHGSSPLELLEPTM
jgi:hypothetical protein